ncbi:hypothetical protein FB451DRAFT_1243807 [Mycena latifolia]|nr:hypothetical protein FB451DRAFT_1243807 [Mycena latifolia]
MSRLFSTITNKNGERRRPRSDSPPDASADAEPTPSTSSRTSTSDLITQSPTTDRIVKKGRAEEPTGVDSPPPSTPTTPTPVRYVSGKILDSPTTSSRLGQRPYGTPAGPACDGWLECRKKVASGISALIDDVHHLVSARPFGHKLNSAALPTARPRLFEEILQLRLMADELQAAFYPQTLPTTADTITKTSTPLPAAPVEAATTKPTYSSAAKAAIPPPAMGSPATKPPTKKPPQKPRLPDKAPPPPTTSRSAPQRLILRFANSSVIKSVSDPQRLRDSLNDALKGASRLRGVNLSRGAPYTATIWGVVRPYFTLGERDRPRFHLDKPWQRVVVHRVPVTTSSTSRSLGIGALADVMGKRREGLRQGVPQETSLLLMLLNADGVFLYGSHCRVSVYDPKKGSR